MERILIVGGAGKFGTYYTRLMKKLGYDVSIISYSSEHTKSSAQHLGVSYITSPEEASSFDTVVFSTPLDKTPEIIKEYEPYLKEGTFVFDLCSVKTQVVPVLKNLKQGIEVASIHPMHGPGIKSLRNINMLAIPIRPSSNYEELKEVMTKRGAIWTETDANKHDELMAYLQAFVHFYALCGATFFQKLNIVELMDFASTNFELVYHTASRIVSQNPELYSQLQELNPYANKVREDFASLVNSLKDSPRKAFFDAYDAVPNKQKILNTTNLMINTLVDNISTTIAALGPEGTFSELVADYVLRYIRGHPKKKFYPNLLSIFKSDADVLVVPVENTVGGTVMDAMDFILNNPRNIFLEVILPVHQSLVSLPGETEIKRIYSHPQALAQCSTYIKKNFPEAQTITTKSTSEAIELLAKKKLRNTAAIGRGDYAKSLGLQIIEPKAEQIKNNRTRFWLLGNPSLRDIESSKWKTSIIVWGNVDRPGLLRDVLDIFAKNSINLTRIESRPSRTRLGAYKFFLDFEAKSREEDVMKLEESLNGEVTFKLLGSYPVIELKESDLGI
ncbi:MAG: prephenate dehydratase [Methanobacteriota archaeon]|nr:MAG: prephenate dehydratase [Euryarchaeota archaeon]